jgi:predicted metalloprotease with PDZ domain
VKFVALLLLALLAAPAAVGARPSTPEPAACRVEYDVRVPDPASRLVSVEAHLEFARAPGAFDVACVDVDGHYTPGYAQFVSGVRLARPNGDAVPLEQVAKNRWRPAANLPAGAYRLSYEVRVDHPTKPSEWGLKETPALDASSGELIGAAVFLYPSPVAAAADAPPDSWPGRAALSVRWACPAGWQVLTPWPGAPSGVQHPASFEDLLDNFVLLTSPRAYDTFAATFDGASVVGAVRRGAWPFEPALLWNGFAHAIRESAAVFGRIPNGRYLVVVEPMPGTKDQPNSTSSGGGAARQSFRAMLDEKTVEKDLTGPGPLVLLAHETFHWWNPIALPPSPESDFFWWHEGVTSYYQALVMWRAGLLSADDFFGELSRQYERGERRNPERPGTSLVEASRRITGDGGPPYDIAYGLGASFAFALDLEIRKQSGGARSLDDLMRALFERYRKTGKKFTYDDLVVEASGLAGTNLRPFFDRYVLGHEKLDWPGLLARVGYEEREVPTGRPYLGLAYEPDGGTKIASVVSGAPADGALRAGDAIRAVDGVETGAQPDVSR